jgi:integrase
MADLYKRGKYWHAKWYDAAGRRQRRSTKQTSERAARRIATEWELASSVRRPDPFRIEEALRLAGDAQVRKGNVERTLDVALTRAEHIERILSGKTDLNAVNLPTLGDTYLDARRRELTPWGTRIEDATTKKELRLLAQGMREGKRLDRFFGDPSAIFPEALRKVGNVRDRWLPVPEYQALLAVATPHRQDWIVFYCNTGVDVGELHGVRKADDLELERGEHGYVHIRGTKTKYRDRWIPLSADARAVVDRRMEVPGPMLFAPEWKSQHVAVCMKRWCPKAGIERVIVKDFRRTFCSWMFNASVPELATIRLMGHGSSEMVRRVYAQLSDATYEDAIGCLPSVANMWQQNVIDFARASKKRPTQKVKRAKNA